LRAKLTKKKKSPF